MKEQLYNILEKLIIKNNIDINKEELRLQLSSHPSYPSLHSLTGVLDHFNIPNLALRLSVNKEMFRKLPACFIADILTSNGEDLVLAEKRKGKIRIVTGTNKTKFIEEQDFLSLWNGIVLAIEKDENIPETKTTFYRSVILNRVVVLIVLLCIGYFLIKQSDVVKQIHFVLSLIGLVISVFIVRHELGLQSGAAKQFCNLSKKTSCDAVLNSKGATILRLFKLSDISMVTFATYCLFSILLFVNGTGRFIILPFVTLMTLPFVIYSLYYQYRVIKKWCPLCLGLATVLVFQFVVMTVDDFSSLNSVFNRRELILFVLSLIIVIGIWNFLKPLIEKKETLQKTEIAYYKFKRKFSLFKLLYDESETLSVIDYFSEELMFGNKNAKVELVIVTNPLCFYCKKTHADIEYLLDKLQDKIKVIVRFNVDTSDKDGLLYRLVTILLNIYNTEGESRALNALSEVYEEDVNLQKWLENQVNKTSNSFDNVLNDQKHWCMINAINFTPALYLNNKLFPQEYDRKDLTYFIDEFAASKDIMRSVLTS
ncbi:vitamin K epoxide reductase family protein [Aquimarina megaterium]|uniref:vitamin K epoxide reductase family protein n=1 Tax=Aquimarina megaterium TaxID=1443666 RepID=UPI0004712540|nr:vitamin K epoxide reductase family protein [Aquimarina megaterium]